MHPINPYKHLKNPFSSFSFYSMSVNEHTDFGRDLCVLWCVYSACKPHRFFVQLCTALWMLYKINFLNDLSELGILIQGLGSLNRNYFFFPQNSFPCSKLNLRYYCIDFRTMLPKIACNSSPFMPENNGLSFVNKLLDG